MHLPSGGLQSLHTSSSQIDISFSPLLYLSLFLPPPPALSPSFFLPPPALSLSQVVVKFIKKATVIKENWIDSKTMGIVPREICLLAQLSHPNIVQVCTCIVCVHV